MLANLFMVVLFLTALFLIVLILIQRGKGGGLAGAFGGLGGQSAFGTKAGDLFTRITIGVAAFWIILCMITVKLFGVGSSMMGEMGGGATTEGDNAPASAPEKPGSSGEGTSSSSAPASSPESSEGGK